ncbi:uncharacterized protein LAESUDRAFT_89775 [Laetiporus sulphureus 93-53]|uniref:Uncharacterized protein n=1 Tax=Laetiporus sulphureus 93-53 TaxID=1314785 RepID=A0A165EXZ3_9APHY|nr:uncharacterized protein LAESUDRAFT_89775 [Laetiporus sulphureus 93-53]KZT07951.1 hypothetical protein LAESUDRAFT_89775 [Laetiporus sulphureus 93-53]
MRREGAGWLTPLPHHDFLDKRLRLAHVRAATWAQCRGGATQLEGAKPLDTVGDASRAALAAESQGGSDLARALYKRMCGAGAQAHTQWGGADAQAHTQMGQRLDRKGAIQVAERSAVQALYKTDRALTGRATQRNRERGRHAQ